ncbi:hypothetical protein D8674_003473 [Pyrus ussuriensis x Pyrus communis]|uniref:Uncharacterized protein n=1 Tax=Pyrus ussuriensis x Pyrus communis TaxID=2448454 RepID=A0A5N5FH66_9ROSA|nr:hypothetical protein D8674_003473 [Pyrus ussuriensis x Pyrus communis]
MSDTDEPRQDNIWRLSFLSSNGPLTVEDSMVKDEMIATVVARNLLTPRDNTLFSRRSDELAVRDSLTLSVRCTGSVSNMGQRQLAQTRQVESLTAEVSLKLFADFDHGSQNDELEVVQGVKLHDRLVV